MTLTKFKTLKYFLYSIIKMKKTFNYILVSMQLALSILQIMESKSMISVLYFSSIWLITTFMIIKCFESKFMVFFLIGKTSSNLIMNTFDISIVNSLDVLLTIIFLTFIFYQRKLQSSELPLKNSLI